MPILQLKDLDIKGKRLVIREDLNVPIKEGVIRNDKRIRAALPTIKLALDGGAGVILISHLGRPTEGEFEEQFSLKPVAARLSELLGIDVKFAPNLDDVQVEAGSCVLCENIRFVKGEKKNDSALAEQLANLGDIYVMDAFGASHRAHASTEGAVRKAKLACAGPLMAAELAAFAKVQDNPKRPLVAIIGGSKVSSKLALLENLLTKVDRLIVGGGIANTFLAAAGYAVGSSLCEDDLIPAAKRILEQAKQSGKILPLPSDVVVAKALAPNQDAQVVDIDKVPSDKMILDVGPKTIANYTKLCEDAATIIWNGPVGAFETEPFGEGTKALGHALAKNAAFVVVGGGDSVAAVEQYGIAQDMDYISTGGGASLELLEGKVLPSVAALNDAGK